MVEAPRAEAVAIQVEAVAIQVEAVAIQVEAVAIQAEAGAAGAAGAVVVPEAPLLAGVLKVPRAAVE